MFAGSVSCYVVTVSLVRVFFRGCCVLHVSGYHTFLFFFSSRRRLTRCALVTGVQTCALPISVARELDVASGPGHLASSLRRSARIGGRLPRVSRRQLGRPSCRERVCQYV